MTAASIADTASPGIALTDVFTDTLLVEKESERLTYADAKETRARKVRPSPLSLPSRGHESRRTVARSKKTR
jgi:hypothetical protein